MLRFLRFQCQNSFFYSVGDVTKGMDTTLEWPQTPAECWLRPLTPPLLAEGCKQRAKYCFFLFLDNELWTECLDEKKQLNSDNVVALRTETIPTRIEPTTYWRRRLDFLWHKASKLLVTKVIFILSVPLFPRNSERGTLSSRSKWPFWGLQMNN